MLNSATIDGLQQLRLHAMAAALAEQNQQAGYAGLSFDERLGLLIDHELTDRASRRVQRSLKTARLRALATVEDIDVRHPRGLVRARILDLAQAHWAEHRRAIVITGPTGAGKTYLVLDGAQDAHGFGLFTTLNVPTGTSTRRLDRRRHRADDRPGAVVTCGPAGGGRNLHRLGAGSWVIRPARLRGARAGARLQHQLPLPRRGSPGPAWRDGR